MPVAMPSVAQVRQLPELLTLTIPPDWQDVNGHVNVQYYLRIYDLAGDPLISHLGMDPAYIEKDRIGYFDLEHHLWFLAEMHVGDEVAAHFRYVAQSTKRFHGVMFIVNRTRNSLAAALEFVTTGAQLDERRTIALPGPVSRMLQQQIAEHARLDWAPPCCGVIAP